MQTQTQKTIKAVSLAVALALPFASLSAKTFDDNLQQAIETSAASELHQVIITFDHNSAPTIEQLGFLEQLGIVGVHLQNLPIVGALATAEQIDQVYARSDVRSVWLNQELSLENNEATRLTGVQKLRADQNLRNQGIPYSGRGIGVVVNDSGVDGTHSDLLFPQHVVQNVLAQTNLNSFSALLPITFRENVANTDIAGGHGTHVAGTVGGNGAMSRGEQAGVAPGASIVGYGSGAGLFILDTLGGFDYALTNQFQYNIRVISNSFGNTGDVGTDFNPDDPTNVATKKLADNGIITVFSAGNSGPGESTITGNFKKAPWVVTVAAGDKAGNLANFSSRGVDGKGATVTVDGETFEWVDRPTITAPGVDIISARASLSSLGALSAQKDADLIPTEQLPYYTVSSGTSMAAPHISGVVALILEANPNLGWREVKAILQDTATVMPGRDAWEAGAGYVNAHAAVKAAAESADIYGDTVKLNRDFNGNAEITEAASFTRTVEYVPVGETSVETFDVSPSTSLVLASATIETGTAFVLEDPAGNRYGSGIGLPVLGSNVGVSAPGMAGTWKVYARGIGSVSGLTLDPLGVTNGIGLPSPVDVSIRLLETSGFEGIDDTQNHPGRAFIELAVNERLMDAFDTGFKPDSDVVKADFADALTLSGAVRQSQNGNQLAFRDSDSANAAFLNSVAAAGSALKDVNTNSLPVLSASTPDFFGVDDQVTRQQQAYSLVQSLGLQALAAEFDPNTPIQVEAFGQIVDVADTDTIAPELRGYVQLALNTGVMQPFLKVEQSPFELEPRIIATFKPAQTFTRAELARSLSQLLPRITQ